MILTRPHVKFKLNIKSFQTDSTHSESWSKLTLSFRYWPNTEKIPKLVSYLVFERINYKRITEKPAEKCEEWFSLEIHITIQIYIIMSYTFNNKRRIEAFYFWRNIYIYVFSKFFKLYRFFLSFPRHNYIISTQLIFVSRHPYFAYILFSFSTCLFFVITMIFNIGPSHWPFSFDAFLYTHSRLFL